VFVNSLSDLFHESIVATDDGCRFIAAVFAVMGATPHVYQVLSKRMDQAARWFSWVFRTALERGVKAPDVLVESAAVFGVEVPRAPAWPLPNVWLGASVEGPEQLERLDVLAILPASLRFASFEPLVARLDRRHLDMQMRAPARDGHRVDWAIVGGESDPSGKARECALEWLVDVVEVCQAANVPVFVKQVGARPTVAGVRLKVVHSKGGDPAEWPERLRVREWPKERAAA
jgi:protein gp37